MSDFSSKSFDQVHNSDLIDDENFENDDIFTFQHNSKKINIHYSQLTKYSKHIRDKYLFSDVINRFPQEIQRFQEESHILPENVDLFFQFLEQNYEINNKSNITYIECNDLIKICKFLEIRKLISKIKQYIKAHKEDVDFIIQILEYDNKMRNEKDYQQNENIKEIEKILTNKINECFSNEKFKGLPIEIIYRIIKNSSSQEINSNKLFDIIKESLNKYCVLFRFLELQNLSEDRLEELCELYSKSNENTLHCFDYLKCNLTLIKKINNRKKNLEKTNDEQVNKLNNLESRISSLQNQLNESKNWSIEQQNKMKELETILQKQSNDSEKIISQLQNQLKESKNLNKEQQNKMKELETTLQKQSNDSEKIISQLQNQINETKNTNKELENQISQLQIQLKKHIPKGQIVASVENGLFINAEINLEAENSSLDTTKSKIIVSTSDAKFVGEEAYEKGKPITSLHMKAKFARKSGKYYVRCIVFNMEGESTEIVSNSVTTSESSLRFCYEGKPAKIILPQGEYELEVWGAKGGDSTGEGDVNEDRGKQKIVEGGLGGYSRGILRLNKEETVYVFVGEEGRPSNSSEGSTTKGGFPDGGSTKTGHFRNFTTVAGTGG